jgi:hypothetical protein
MSPVDDLEVESDKRRCSAMYLSMLGGVNKPMFVAAFGVLSIGRDNNELLLRISVVEVPRDQFVSVTSVLIDGDIGRCVFMVIL